MEGLISPLYNLVYNATFDWHLGFIYCLACTFYVLMLAILAYVYANMKTINNKLREKLNSIECKSQQSLQDFDARSAKSA